MHHVIMKKYFLTALNLVLKKAIISDSTAIENTLIKMVEYLYIYKLLQTIYYILQTN